MRKTFFFGLAVLLALAIVACDNFSEPAKAGSNVVGYTADGRAIVELDVSVGGSNGARALHETLAQAGVDYYEVIFVDHGNPGDPGTGGLPSDPGYVAPIDPRTGSISRLSWREGAVAKLRVVTDVDYDNSLDVANLTDKGSAYVFAGRYSDKTLLAVGKLIAPTLITDSMTSVTFEIQALETNITDDAATSTFQQTPVTDFYAQKMPINEVDVTVYSIFDDAATSATFDITNDLATDGLAKAIVVASTADAVKTLPFILTEEGAAPPAKLASVTITNITANNPVAFPLRLTITPTIPGGGKAKAGLTRIFIDLPVYLYNNSTQDKGTDAVTWYFRSGLNNKFLDTGYDNMSLGGAILIGIGDVFAGGPGSKEIIVDWK